MHRIFGSLLLGAALMVPVVAVAQTPYQEHRYYDRPIATITTGTIMKIALIAITCSGTIGSIATGQC